MRYFDIQTPLLDATRLMFKELESDKRASKIDLGIGIYRDEKGEAPVFKAVKKAETLLLQTEVSKSLNISLVASSAGDLISKYLIENLSIKILNTHNLVHF